MNWLGSSLSASTAIAARVVEVLVDHSGEARLGKGFGHRANVAAPAERQQLHEEALVGPLRRPILEPAALAQIRGLEPRPAFWCLGCSTVRAHAVGGA